MGVNEMIEVQLVGGPDDGSVMRLDSHRFKILMPHYDPLPPFFYLFKRPEPVKMRVGVYEKVPACDRYGFVRMEVW